MHEEQIECFNCGKKLNVHKEDGRPSWYGSYRNAELVQAVCAECYANGVRTDIGKEIERQMASRER